MRYVLEPTLEHIALVKIVVTLWNQNDIRTLLMKFDFPQLYRDKIKKWQQIENSVSEKVLHIPQMGLYEQKIISFIKPIGLQILKWMEYHCTGHYLHVDLPVELCWTPQGTVNRKKTAEVLIKDENLYIGMRYKLAYIYCFEDYIQDLWNKISSNLRVCLSFELCPTESSQQDGGYPWRYDIKKGQNRRIFDYLSAFKTYAHDGNKVATEYFLQKLTPRERKKSIINVAKNVKDGEVLSFLLSHMNEKQQIEFFKSKPYKVLECFLEFPLQSFFIDISNRMWNFLSKWDYSVILKDIANKKAFGYKDWNYQSLFAEFWLQSPDDFKRYIINELNDGFLLSDLFMSKDKANLKLILQNMNLIRRKKLIYCDTMLNQCQNLITDDEWDLLEFFIKECLSSEEEIIKFKREFEQCITSETFKDYLLMKKNRWDKLCLSDEFASKYGKRSIKEAEIGSSKHHRTV